MIRRLTDFLAQREKPLFFMLVLLHLLPIWGFSHVITQDGACHLHTARSIQEFHRPDRDLIRKYFTLSVEPDPYWASNLLLSAFLHVTTPEAAEKILVSLYVILFPLAARYLAGSVDRKNAFLGWLSLPFIFNIWYHLGFYNLCLSLVLYCFLVGYWFRNSLSLKLSNLFVMAGFSIALYFTHPLTSLFLVISLCLLMGWMTLCDLVRALLKKIPFEEVWKTVEKRAGFTTALIPFLVLLAVFLGSFANRPPRPILPVSTLYFSLTRYLGFATMRSFESFDKYIYWALFLVLFGLMARTAFERVRSRRLENKDGFLLLVLAAAALFFGLTPQESISFRFSVFAVLTAIAYAAAGSYGRSLQACIQIGAALSAALFVGNMIPYYMRIDRNIRDCVSVASHMLPNRTLLYLCLERKGFTSADKLIRFRPMRHLGNLIAAKKNLVSLNNYEATELYLPLQYLAELNPYMQLGGYPEGEEPWIDVQGYPKRTGGTIDYIVVSGVTQETIGKEFFEQLLRQLYAEYKMVYKSKSKKTALFMHKSLVTPPADAA